MTTNTPDGGPALTPKQQYEARKAERKERQEINEELARLRDEVDMYDQVDRMIVALESIALSLEKLANPLIRVKDERAKDKETG